MCAKPPSSGEGQVTFTSPEAYSMKMTTTGTLRGKRLGLALSEIRELIDMYESPKDEAAQLTKFVEVLARAQAKLKLLEARVTELEKK